MEVPRRGRLGHFIPHWLNREAFFFITVCCQPLHINQLCLEPIAAAVLSTVEFYHRNESWSCRLFLLMPNHVHGIVAFPGDPGIRATVSNWKRYCSRVLGIRWQRDFFDHRLRNERELTEKANYILNNPVRKRLCEMPEQWPHVWCPPQE